MVRRTKKWEEILKFAEWLAIYGKHYSHNSNFEEQRIAVVLLDQSIELMMKAFLIKVGYVVEYFSKENVNRGLKETDSFGEEKTIEFLSALKLVKEKIPSIDKKEIKHFHQLRNKIYHGVKIELMKNKVLEMDNFIPELKKFYESAFEDRSFESNIIDRVSEVRDRSYR